MKVPFLGIRLAAAFGACLVLAEVVAQAAQGESKSKTSAATQSDGDASTATLPDFVKAERQVAKNPHDKKARLAAARAQLAQGAESSSRVEAAQQHVEAVLAENPNDFDALMLAGQTSLLKADASAAARYYQAATAANSRSASAFLAWGDALSRLGDEPGSSAAFAKYRELMGMQAVQENGTAK